MKRNKNLLIITIIIIITACNQKNEEKSEQKPPNIIFIMADDLGYGDLSCFGSTEIETPNLDQLAQQGMKLTQFYAGAPICTPTRVAFLTGLFPARFGINNAFHDKKGQYLPDTVMTIPKVLKQAGYFTAHIGKWHMGGVREEDFMNRQKNLSADPGPFQHGFDYYLSNIEEKVHRGILYHGDSIFKRAGYHMVRNDSMAPPIDKWWDEIKADEAIKVMEKRSKSDHPFFISLNFFTPHVPYEPAPGGFLEEYIRKGARGYDLLYRSMVSNMDYHIGRIIKKLDELDLTKNTVIIFTSDNGPYVEGNTVGMKGRKFDMHEGGVKVPAIIRWPAKIKAGTVNDSPIQITDLLPTFNAMAGLQEPEFYYDGMDITEYLVNNKPIQDREVMYWQQIFLKMYPEPDRKRYDTLYRKSTMLNKMLTSEGKPEPYSTEAIRKGDWKLYLMKGKPIELINITSDSFEENNLIKKEPDITRELMNELDRLNLKRM